MNLTEAYSIEIEATPPFSFELTVHKPAGWWWSTPDETFEKDTLWTVTRFKNTLIGLKLKSLGTLQKPRISCTIFSKAKISKTEAQNLTRMVKRALNTEQDITEFYKLAQKDKILNASSQRPVRHAHRSMARTIPRVNLSRDTPNGTTEEKRPNDATTNGTLRRKNPFRRKNHPLLAFPTKNRRHNNRRVEDKSQTRIQSNEPQSNRRNIKNWLPNNGRTLDDEPSRSKKETPNPQGNRRILSRTSNARHGFSIWTSGAPKSSTPSSSAKNRNLHEKQYRFSRKPRKTVGEVGEDTHSFTS